MTDETAPVASVRPALARAAVGVAVVIGVLTAGLAAPMLILWLAARLVSFDFWSSLAGSHVWEVRWAAAVLVLAVAYAGLWSVSARWPCLGRRGRVRLVSLWALGLVYAAGCAWLFASWVESSGAHAA